MLLTGSSPLTRGKRQGHAHEGSHRGIIPAHAGKTTRNIRRACPMRDHPRSRGENVAALITVIVSLGSSPLTRGKRVSRLSRRRLSGIIPAHAGKTARERDAHGGVGDHPRSRGENRRASPPRPISPGIIPAHAGKTRRPGRRVCHPRDHPRSRGENPPQMHCCNA